ncbi:hypothetical protein [Formosa haliotis]|uniref:hypothetical protein n=1 Tax=Formosa haliotis TaxID=1555194 RepID=UPI0011466BD5|nr:hypothetical protein [Formosa haliotis]
MKKTTIFTCFIFYLFSYTCLAQNTNIAKAYYINAREAYEKKDFKGSMEYLENAKQEIKGTNPDIIYLELLCNYNIDKLNPNIDELSMEFINSANSGDERINEVSLISVEHKELVAKEKEREKEMYNLAVSANELTYIRNYLEAYPSGERAKEIEAVLEQKEITDYNNALEINTVEAYVTFNQNYPNSDYFSEIKTRLDKARDFELHEKALKEDTVYYYKLYLTNYPDGNYREEIEAAFENKLLITANEEFKTDNVNAALKTYESYRELFPEGKNIYVVNQRIEELQDKIDKENKLNDRTSANYFMLTYSSDNLFGFQFGKVHLNKIGAYFNLNVNKSVTKLQFSIDHTIPELSNEYEEASISSSFGLSYKITYPIWIYAGGGVKYIEYFQKDNEDFAGIEVEGKSAYNFYPEIGLQVKIKKIIVIKTGVLYIDSDIYFQGGIGIQTRNW